MSGRECSVFGLFVFFFDKKSPRTGEKAKPQFLIYNLFRQTITDQTHFCIAVFALMWPNERPPLCTPPFSNVTYITTGATDRMIKDPLTIQNAAHVTHPITICVRYNRLFCRWKGGYPDKLTVSFIPVAIWGLIGSSIYVNDTLCIRGLRCSIQRRKKKNKNVISAHSRFPNHVFATLSKFFGAFTFVKRKEEKKLWKIIMVAIKLLRKPIWLAATLYSNCSYKIKNNSPVMIMDWIYFGRVE